MAGELSIVIPLLNEAESLRQLYAEITAVCEAEGLDAEIIFVDDGSTDGSWEIIRELAARD
ncbi:MAG: glycosyltransferase, partial [Chloroflexi bacterium]|nr:glycosyltransferase [Chloroflexota bacterium]